MTPYMRLLPVAAVIVMGCGRYESTRTKQPSPQASTPQQAVSTPAAGDWPFQDRENTAVITLTRVVDGTRPILYVVHDDDGDWQFLDGGEASDEDAAVVSLRNVCERDPTIKMLANLPVGWAAERATVGEEWHLFQQ